MDGAARLFAAGRLFWFSSPAIIREWSLAQGAGAPGQATASATAAAAAAAPDAASKAAAASASASPAAASPAAASSASAASASAAATAMTASAAAASNELKAGGDRSLLVEHIECRQADVGDFFLTERKLVARLDMPRRDIRGGAGRLCGCAADQRQQSSGPQYGYCFAPTLSLRSLLRVRPPSGDDTDQ